MSAGTAETDHGGGHATLKGYVVGLLLCLLLTGASFGVVMGELVPQPLRLTAIVVLCVVQLVAQLVLFLHIGAGRSQRENTGIFLCTAFLIAIVVAGSLWVMHNATQNMMPMQL
ncbi:cytochrome o ubiquinol oxidase subunit IV [Stenotrophomonas rhizophila]|uniref:cytochrome o ubiquinol oxidase subunit IV n=1 Tax=Stenotrophomonas rhizophila TaxID=216778 RepID=UPI001E4FAD50|nr:cytochrome o ubiquinol oxidase subunit IV [Stenotrophomonas rhizophila]MCC7633912.1 cytochrome o ubiquinol oxidase subunit IV [Stenotrophomonas rhizophila]MCC7663246.1 cytochrome o ubiquinol oxidase subunit IV [Stenotrophomonas rhizophila]